MDETNFKCVCGNTTFHPWINSAGEQLYICDKCNSHYSSSFELYWDFSIQKKTKLIPCSACGKEISPNAESCPNCGQPTGIHTCPKCGSRNTQIISGGSKVGSILVWGVFSANKILSRYKCRDCHHKF